jgi:glucose-6-phosphate isomerase
VKPAPLRQRPAWSALTAHHRRIAPLHLRELFAKDPGRGGRLTVEAAGIFLDFSENHITDETMALLVQLAAGSGLRDRIDAMFRGER